MYDGQPDGKLEVLLREAELVTQDIHKRLEVQRQSFNYALIAFGVLAAIITNDLKEEHFEGSSGDQNLKLHSADPDIPLLYTTTTFLILITPLLVGPLAFIFFDDELIIFRNLAYLKTVALPAIKTCAGMCQKHQLPLQMDALYGLSLFSKCVHPLLSLGRWILFVVPVCTPSIYAFAESKIDYFGLFSADSWWSWRAMLFGVDLAICALLFIAIAAALVEQARWRALFA